jgi:hypothetical protein
MAPRQQVTYMTDEGLEFQVTMASEAEIPAEWECPSNGQMGRRVGGDEPELKKEKPVRTHWDMLLERRSIKELEDILTERLELLRAGEIGPAHLHKAPKKKKSA